MVRALRWVLFLPIGLLLQSLLSAVPRLLYLWIFPVNIESAFWRIIATTWIVLVGVSGLFWVGMLAYWISVMSCRKVAPRLAPAQGIYGAFLVFIGVVGLFYGITQSDGWIINAYNAGFIGVCILGVLHAGRDC
jgi:hypothetical protein